MRGTKSENLLAIIDFLYCGKANVDQKDLDSFLAIAEEIQLKGFMGKVHNDELTQTGTVELPVPKTANQLHKKDENTSRSSGPFQTKLISESDEADMTVALTSCSSGNLQELDAKCDSMMEKTKKKQGNGQPVYRCKVCGKEAMSGDLKKHIEANHLEGVSIPCSCCEKTFRSISR